MLQVQTILRIRDNSGARKAICIKVLGKCKPRYAKLGDIIIISIRQIRLKNRLEVKVKKGQILWGLIVRTKVKFFRPELKSIKLNENSIVLLDKQYKPIATRIIGKIPRELRSQKLMRVISISPGTI